MTSCRHLSTTSWVTPDSSALSVWLVWSGRSRTRASGSSKHATHFLTVLPAIYGRARISITSTAHGSDTPPGVLVGISGRRCPAPAADRQTRSHHTGLGLGREHRQ